MTELTRRRLYRTGQHHDTNIYEVSEDAKFDDYGNRADDDHWRDKHVACAFTPRHGRQIVEALNFHTAFGPHIDLSTSDEPRDVLATRIVDWATDGDWRVYDYADALLRDLDAAGYRIVRKEET